MDSFSIGSYWAALIALKLGNVPVKLFPAKLLHMHVHDLHHSKIRASLYLYGESTFVEKELGVAIY